MTDPVKFENGVPKYAWSTTSAFSPPAKWSETLVRRISEGVLTPCIPDSWRNADISLIPALVQPPPQNCDSEIRDLFAMKPFRGDFPMIGNENAWVAADFTRLLLLALQAAGANLDQPIGKVTAEQHIKAVGSQVFNDAEIMVLAQKALFNRPRPYQVAPGLMPMFQPPHAAYPSGHSTQMHTLAWVLREGLKKTKYREVAYAFCDYATAVARRREIAGLHYASDTVAGMSLAHVLLEIYRASSEFMTENVFPLRDFE